MVRKCCRFVVAIAVLLTLTVSSIPASVGAEVTPTDKEVLAMAKAQLGQRWYGIYVLGKKVGWQEDRWSDEEQRICNRSEFTLKLAFLGKVSTISSVEKTCYAVTPPYAMISYSSTRNEDGRRVTIEGRREGDQLAYTISTGNQVRTDRVAADSDLLAHAVGWAPIARMTRGDTIASSNFDELTGKSRWQKYTLEGVEKKTLRGGKQTVFKIRIQDEVGLDLQTLVNQSGIILEGALGPSIRIVLEDKASAKRKDLDLLDLYSTTFITAVGDIDYARVTQVKRFSFKLKGEGELRLADNTRQTIVKGADQTLSIAVDACTPPKVSQSPELSRFLACNADIPCDDQATIDLATKQLPKGASALERALALSQWVHRNFQYSLASGGGTGDQILAARKGDCTEYSKALITLLRAVKIPARQLSGIVLASDTPPSFGYHAWVEVWIDGTGWVSVDPTWGAYPVDATHVVFDVDEGLQMAAHLGGLELTVDSIEYAKEADKLCD